MKCIHCSSDTTYPVRSSNGKRCGSCLHPFAFEPKTDPRSVSDGLFQKCISDVSAEGTLQFTARQLYFEMNRRLVKKNVHIPKPYGIGAAACGGAGLIGAVVGIHLLIPIGIVGVIAACVMGAKVGSKMPQSRVVRLSFGDFQNLYLQVWLRTHGQIPGLLPSLSQSRSRVPPVISADPPDLTSYSFDRALVCDRADVAAMLVANRFHFENNCAILSIDGGFPANGRFAQVREMLRRNPRLIVFSLHNADPSGLTMAPKLRQNDWFPGIGHVIDLGLRPKHAIKANMLLEQQAAGSVPPDLRATLEPDEVKWLEAGFTADIESLRPAKLMRSIYQAFARSTQVGPDGEIIIVDSGPTIWAYDSGADVYAVDSFG